MADMRRLDEVVRRRSYGVPNEEARLCSSATTCVARLSVPLVARRTASAVLTVPQSPMLKEAANVSMIPPEPACVCSSSVVKVRCELFP